MPMTYLSGDATLAAVYVSLGLKELSYIWQSPVYAWYLNHAIGYTHLGNEYTSRRDLRNVLKLKRKKKDYYRM